MTTPGSSSSRAAQISGEETRAYTLQAIPPQAFGKYTLIGKLGHGGMAEVLLAVMGGKAGFRKLVVLKRLHPQLEIDPQFVDMFLDEARLAAQLDHPNCVQTTEVGDVDGMHFLAMEYLDGQGLERLLRSSAQNAQLLPVATATRIVADALEGLAYAHELSGYDGRPLGVVHRDVSPQNILVTYNGVGKLLDFGIAKAESNVVETRTGVVKGKYAYIAPEQALGQAVDQRADLWSMGVVLWECLTSRRLFKSVNELATLQETLRGEIKPPSVHNPAVPPELDAIVMHALQREPDLRFQSATLFKEALEEWLGAQSPQPTRRTIAALMKERFEEVQRVHKEKLAACLAAVEVGPSTIQKLVEGAGATGSGIDSGPFAQMTPSNARLIAAGAAGRGAAMGGGAPVSVTPTPMPSMPPVVVPHAAPIPGARAASARAEDETRRAFGWKLVVVGGVALVAVLIAIAVPRYEQGGARGDEPVVGAVAPSSAAPGSVAAPPGSTGTPVVGVPLGSTVTAPLVPSPIVASPVEPTAIEPTAIEPTAIEPAIEPAIDTAHDAPRRGAPRRTGRAPTEAETTAVAAPVAPPSEESVGYLSLITSPWTTVTVDGRTLGDTPLVRERLPVGRHTLRLVNSEAGISETYDVVIEPGETTSRRLGLR